VLNAPANSEYASMGSGGTVDRHLKFSGFVANGTNNVGHRLSARNAIALNVSDNDALYIDREGTIQTNVTKPFGSDTANLRLKLTATGTNYSSGAFLNIVFGDETLANSYLGDIQVVQGDPSVSTSSSMRFLTNTGGGNSNTLERMRIDSSGNVGIGTSSPQVIGAGNTSFTVAGSAGAGTIVKGSSVTGEIYASDAGGGVFISSKTNHPVILRTNDVERMRITSTGNVGINTSSPTALQEIFLTTAGKALRLNTNFANGNSVDLNPYVTGINNGGFEIRINDAPKLVIWTNDDLHVDGDVIAYSTTISDERLKDDVQTIDNALDKVSNLRGVSYTWNNGNRKGQKDLGLIAQEVEQVLPELVREKEMPMIDGGTYKTIDYEKIVGVLIEAVKELRAEVETLKTK